MPNEAASRDGRIAKFMSGAANQLEDGRMQTK
jgi:hypothetical protein